MRKSIENSLLTCFFLLTLGAVPVVTGMARAEVVMDGTLGPGGPITGPAFTIGAELGQTVDTNLFHSFTSFSIGTNESATFTGPATVANIIGRVSGTDPSQIDGLLQSDIAGADLFLLNPNGIFFGPSASLNLGGSFHASTADFIRLGDEGVFYAAISKESHLAVAPPSAFGFLSDSPAGISVQQNTLQVPDGKTLSLVGGDVGITDARLLAPGGRIDIAAVAAVGEVVPNDPSETDNLTLVSFDSLATINVANSLVNSGALFTPVVRV